MSCCLPPDNLTANVSYAGVSSELAGAIFKADRKARASLWSETPVSLKSRRSSLWMYRYRNTPGDLVVQVASQGPRVTTTRTTPRQQHGLQTAFGTRVVGRSLSDRRCWSLDISPCYPRECYPIGRKVWVLKWIDRRESMLAV
jgi:hypothetical protein